MPSVPTAGERLLSGRHAVLGLVAFTALFAAALWYFQTRAFYGVLASGAVTIRLTPMSGGVPQPIPSQAIEAIDAPTSPLKFRACFRTRQSLARLRATFLPAPDATPLVAPGWFDCFDAAAIAADLDAGTAFAFMGEQGIAPGADRVVVVYPDGRAFAWHQLNGDE